MNNGSDFKEKLVQFQQKISSLKKALKSCSLPPDILQKIDEIALIFEEEPKNILKEAGVSAQVSIYPLRVPSLSPIINEALAIFNSYGLDVYPGSMSTVISGNDEITWTALRDVFAASAAEGEVVMTVTVSNACPLPSKPGKRATAE